MSITQELGLSDPDGTKGMSHRMIDLIERVLDDEQRLLPFVYQCYQHRQTEAILSYLAENKLTGWKLWNWIHAQFGRSFLSPIQEIVRRIENQKRVRPIMAGKDYILNSGRR